MIKRMMKFLNLKILHLSTQLEVLNIHIIAECYILPPIAQ